MTLPRVQPIAPTWHKEPFDVPDWLFDFKYDGFRAVCYLERRRNRLVSRNNNIMTRFDALADQVAAALNIDDAILDGEIIAADETGRPVFIDLLRGTRSPCYIAFDLLWLNGIDLQPLPLYERRQALQTILPKGSPTVSEPLSVIGRGRELYELMCAHDLEGVVAKRLADAYDPRVRWLKIKNPDYTQKEGRGDLLNAPRQRPWNVPRDPDTSRARR
jgi:bifunctional non-homologous end joining protein LigD